MIIKLGDDGVTVNLLQACYWRKAEPSLREPDAIRYEIVFAGNTSLILSESETAFFLKFLEQNSSPRLIQAPQTFSVPAI